MFHSYWSPSMAFLGMLNKVLSFLSSPVRPFPRGCLPPFVTPLIHQALALLDTCFLSFKLTELPRAEGLSTSCSLHLEGSSARSLNDWLLFFSSQFEIPSLPGTFSCQHEFKGVAHKQLPFCIVIIWKQSQRKCGRNSVQRKLSLDEVRGRCPAEWVPTHSLLPQRPFAANTGILS